ncbi:hypothetical protein AURDEDRAFT_177731 [Auricularia subglabra TFB-10046 SS5]|uniref:Uncharacterized protein n=1 Tax=Auricularia subglabra (strain TFB-10046 / SS5) TaxID=717982 RepID=J0D3D0_AURST|nr:hypothetical protein AURDEDRAFT_177731 [Auricularia subglabra TFB-10046 SS5]
MSATTSVAVAAIGGDDEHAHGSDCDVAVVPTTSMAGSTCTPHEGLAAQRGLHMREREPVRTDALQLVVKDGGDAGGLGVQAGDGARAPRLGDEL